MTKIKLMGEVLPDCGEPVGSRRDGDDFLGSSSLLSLTFHFKPALLLLTFAFRVTLGVAFGATLVKDLRCQVGVVVQVLGSIILKSKLKLMKYNYSVS